MTARKPMEAKQAEHDGCRTVGAGELSRRPPRQRLPQAREGAVQQGECVMLEIRDLRPQLVQLSRENARLADAYGARAQAQQGRTGVEDDRRGAPRQGLAGECESLPQILATGRKLR